MKRFAPGVLSFAVALFGLVPARVSAAPPGKPNVIIILTDDQGYADLGSQEVRRDIRTPHLDRLAREGVRMTAGYITAPQCSPSRAGLITGRYQQRFGFDSIPDGPLPREELTIAARLRAAGYVSGQVGKWHLDPNSSSARWIARNLPEARVSGRGRVPIPEELRRAYSPLAYGFEECFSGETRSYFATFERDGRLLSKQGQRVNTGNAYRIDVQTDAALAFLQRHRDRPFLLYLCYFGPHVPLAAPGKYLNRFPGEMPERRRYALAMLSAIDDGVGRILDALENYGLDEKTLVAFTSDNGAPLQMHMNDTKPVDLISADWDGSMNEPWIGEKGMLMEGGIRVPFLLRWKGVLPAGRTYREPVISLDLAATAIAIAGLPPDNRLDGVNLIPFLTGEKSGVPHEGLFWRFWNQGAVRIGRWKYLTLGNGAEFLFDLESDRHEQTNELRRHPEIARRLAGKFTAWAAQLQPPGAPHEPLTRQESRWYEHYLDYKSGF